MHELRFQSLFFWKRRENNPRKSAAVSASPVSILVFLEEAWKRWHDTHSTTWTSSFNPCFSGRGVKTTIPEAGTVTSLMFQSLFFWKRRENLHTLYLLDRLSTVSILVFLEEAWKLDEKMIATIISCEFQSLFFWKRRENRNCLHK